MKPRFWKIVRDNLLLLPVGMFFFTWISLLHIEVEILHPIIMDQTEAFHALFLMCGANMIGNMGIIVLTYYFYCKACDKCRKPSGKL